MSCRIAHLAVASIALLAAVHATPAQAVQVLTDPGFEANPLTTLGNVLSNLPAFQNQWGHENAAIVAGPDGGVTQSGGLNMLKVFDTGSYSQTGQVVDVTSFAAAIDAGNAIVSGSALFNANLPAAEGSVSVSFVDSSATWGNFTGPDLATGNFVLDSAAQTWQSIGASSTIPTGTRWLFIQVAYRDATLMNSVGALGQGYVDDAVLDVRVVPEPTTLAALGAAGAMFVRRRRA